MQHNEYKSDPNQNKIKHILLKLLIRLTSFLVITICLAILYIFAGDQFEFKAPPPPLSSNQPSFKSTYIQEEWDQVENGVHLATGLKYDRRFKVVRANCTTCHSGKLIAQNRADREGWRQMIRWMQETQGLWDLGANETVILDYLTTHYAPEAVGRRANISMEEVEWYILEL